MKHRDHSASPLLLSDDAPDLDDVRDALAGMDAVDVPGRDIAATLAWATTVTPPRSLGATWELLASVSARDVAAARVLELGL